MTEPATRIVAREVADQVTCSEVHKVLNQIWQEKKYPDDADYLIIIICHALVCPGCIEYASSDGKSVKSNAVRISSEGDGGKR